jgi:hypothetical protein
MDRSHADRGLRSATHDVHALNRRNEAAWLVPYTGVRNPLDHFTLLGAPGVAGLSGSGTLAGLCMASVACVFAPVDGRKSSCLPCQ